MNSPSISVLGAASEGELIAASEALAATEAGLEVGAIGKFFIASRSNCKYNFQT